ncbi:MAG: MATE family efflux transporter [Candidatus Heritagella sp.]
MRTASKSNTMDMTQGNILRQLTIFAIPLLIGGIFQLVYNLTDTIILGKFVSATALACIGAASSAYSMVLMLGQGMTNAISIIISQATGAGDESQVRRATAHALYVAFSAGIVLGLLSFFLARPLLQLLGTPSNILEEAVLYLQVTCGLTIGTIFYNASAAILRAIGDSRTPLFFLIFCTFLNIGLDLWFVLGMQAGVAGVAWATILSQFVSAGMGIFYMLRKYPQLRFSRREAAFDPQLFGRFMRVGIPLSLQTSLLSIGMLVITSVINSYGSDIVAAFTVGSKVEQLAVVAISQFAFSYSVFAGQNFGARQYARIRQGVKKALLLVLGLTVLSMAVILLFGDTIALLFLDAGETSILPAATSMIYIEAWFYPALGIIWLYNSALRGVGKVGVTFASSMVELFSKVGLSILLSFLFGWYGIWFAAPIGWILGLIPSVLYFHFGRWEGEAPAVPTELKEAV